MRFRRRIRGADVPVVLLVEAFGGSGRGSFFSNEGVASSLPDWGV